MALPDANLGYSYDTLPGPKSIRLLTLHPAEHITDSIKCSIEIVNLLAEKDKYDALSYSWGMDSDGSGDAFLLTLDDKAFSITQNLWDGLKRIRRCKEPVRIWIDAVCINQNDDAEKSVQVVMMADIYAGAKTVSGSAQTNGRARSEGPTMEASRAASSTLLRPPTTWKRCFAMLWLRSRTGRCYH
jgi:hypothetical protein